MKESLRRVLAPLIEADQGQLFWVSGSETQLRLHLAGKFSGCPGTALITEQIIQPVVRSLCPACELIVTTGALIPPQAERLSSQLNS